MNGTRLAIALVLALAVAAGNWFVVQALAVPSPVPSPLALAWLLGAPFVLALAVALVPERAAAAAPREAPAAEPPAPRPATADGALRLLALLQQEGRFVDFLAEDLSPYGDEQIGGAVRSIHEGCRRAVHAQFAFEPVMRGEEGEDVTVEPGFDAAAVRLTGNVTGSPPFRGVLRHTGWRVTSATLPDRRGGDPRIIAPAEVEIP